MQRGELSLGFGAGYCGDSLGALAAAGKARQRLEGGLRRPKTAQHRVKRDRADRLGAAQSQPVEALLRIEFARGQD
jgi:hypothetical protein